MHQNIKQISNSDFHNFNFSHLTCNTTKLEYVMHEKVLMHYTLYHAVTFYAKVN